MRIGYWKSGQVCAEFTEEEVKKLGGYGTPVTIRLAHRTKKGKPSKNEMPQFIVEANENSTYVLKKKQNAIAKLPELVGCAHNNDKRELFEARRIPDFSMLQATNVEWDGPGSSGKPHARVDLDWDNRRPARGKAPVNGNGHAKGKDKVDRGDNLALTAIELSVRAAIIRLNRLIEEYPERIELHVDENDGKLRAMVRTTTVTNIFG